MTLPADTKFQSASPFLGRELQIFWLESFIHCAAINTIGVRVGFALDREQVESLRDQLTQWLELQPCGS